ncbi:hypothetical protein D3C87_1584100 [compost metagenome]
MRLAEVSAGTEEALITTLRQSCFGARHHRMRTESRPVEHLQSLEHDAQRQLDDLALARRGTQTQLINQIRMNDVDLGVQAYQHARAVGVQEASDLRQRLADVARILRDHRQRTKDHDALSLGQAQAEVDALQLLGAQFEQVDHRPVRDHRRTVGQ